MREKEEFKTLVYEKYQKRHALQNKRRRLFRRTAAPIAVLLAVCVVTTAVLNKPQYIQAANLMEGIDARAVQEREADETFMNAYADFAINLFQESVRVGREEEERPETENCMISPLSLTLALAMTANGADGETKEQMEAMFGGIPIQELNEYLHTYVTGLLSEDEGALGIANSVWYRDGWSISRNFLQTNADYYGADAFMSAFDRQTVDEINSWVADKTDGMIDRVLDEINDATLFYLINAIVFDAEWWNGYSDYNLSDGTFTAVDGTEQAVTMMHSKESFYIDDGMATGFIKPYGDGGSRMTGYAFAVLLPNEDVDIYDYIQSLTGESFLRTMWENEGDVIAEMPKFSFEYELEMNDVLKALGMTDAFGPARADFTKMCQTSQGNRYGYDDNLYITKVFHKTLIEVAERGTKAGAATTVEGGYGGALQPNPNPHEVVLDRPFVFAIVDGNGLPVFLGAVMSIEE